MMAFGFCCWAFASILIATHYMPGYVRSIGMAHSQGARSAVWLAMAIGWPFALLWAIGQLFRHFMTND